MSADRRRTARQYAQAAAGIHPLTGSRADPDPTHSCGNCYFRRPGGPRGYPKCWYRPGETGPLARITGGPATDVRAWWPGCGQWQA
jgi:hypothetical protein